MRNVASKITNRKSGVLDLVQDAKHLQEIQVSKPLERSKNKYALILITAINKIMHIINREIKTSSLLGAKNFVICQNCTGAHFF